VICWNWVPAYFYWWNVFCLVLSLNKLWIWNSMNHQINILFDYKLINIADCEVCFCRLMSQLADVNIQLNVGMFSFYVVLYSSFCYRRWTRLILYYAPKFPRWFFHVWCVNIYGDLHLIRHYPSLVGTLDSTENSNGLEVGQYLIQVNLSLQPCVLAWWREHNVHYRRSAKVTQPLFVCTANNGPTYTAGTATFRNVAFPLLRL